MSARTGCCQWNMAKLDPSDGSVVWKAKIVGSRGTTDSSDIVWEIEPLIGTNDMLVIVGNNDPLGLSATITLCRVDETGAVLWSFDLYLRIAGIAGAPSFSLRIVGSDATTNRVIVSTSAALVGLDYDGNVIWSVANSPRADTWISNVMVAPGFVLAQSLQLATPNILSYDAASGRFISSQNGFGPFSSNFPIVTIYAPVSDSFVTGYVDASNNLFLGSFAGPSGSFGSPYTVQRSTDPSTISFSFARGRSIESSDFLFISQSGSAMIQVRSGAMALIHSVASIAGSSAPFDPQDLDTNPFTGLIFIGANSQDRGSGTDQFSVMATDYSGALEWSGPQVGKGASDSKFLGLGGICPAVSLDDAQSWLYVGGALGNG